MVETEAVEDTEEAMIEDETMADETAAEEVVDEGAVESEDQTAE